MKYLEILDYISHGYSLKSGSYFDFWFLYWTLVPLWNSGSIIEVWFLYWTMISLLISGSFIELWFLLNIELWFFY